MVHPVVTSELTGEAVTLTVANYAAGPCAVQTRYSGDALPDTLARSQPRSAVRKKFRAARSLRRRAARRERLERGDLVVLDRNGEWFAQWDQQFRELAIPALRSGTTAHPCPVCSNSLDVCVLVRPPSLPLYACVWVADPPKPKQLRGLHPHMPVRAG